MTPELKIATDEITKLKSEVKTLHKYISRFKFFGTDDCLNCNGRMTLFYREPGCLSCETKVDKEK